MAGEDDIQEATGRRASAQAVVTRHLNALKKLLTADKAVGSDEAVEYHTKLTDALTKFNNCHDIIIALCDEHDADKTDHLELHCKITTGVDEVLEQLHVKVNGIEEQSPTHGAGSNALPAGTDLSPGSKKTLSLIQLAMSTMQTGDNSSVDVRLERQAEQHRKETEGLRTLIESLRQELGELKRELKPGPPQMSTPAGLHPGRVTFNLQNTTIGDGMNSYYDNHRAGGKESRDTSDISLATRQPTVQTSNNYDQGCSKLGQDPAINSLLLQQQVLEQSLTQHRSLMATLKAPALTIPKFNGDPLEYATFIGAFDELVDKVLDNPRAKLTSLISYCGEKPMKYIRSCQHEPAEVGYAHARRMLKERFGSEFVVSQAWIDKLLGYPVLKTPEAMESFSADLVSGKNALDSLGYTAELRCTNNMRLLVAKLPFTLRTRWRKLHREVQLKKNGDPLDKLMDLVREAAEDLTDPAYSETAISQLKGKTATDRSSGYNPGFKRASVHCLELEAAHDFDDPAEDGHPGADRGVYASERSDRDRPTCSVCGSSIHFTARCKQYRSLEANEKLKLVTDKRLCRLCLSSRHSVDACPLPWKCQEKKCNKRHHTSLHVALGESVPGGGRPESVNSVSISSEDLTHVVNHLTDNSFHVSRVVPTLPLTPVTVRYAGNTVNTYALLDQGSTLTMCHKRVSDTLGMKPSGTSSVNIKTVNGVSQVTGNSLDFEVAGLNIKKFFPVVDAMEVGELPISLNHMATASRITEWAHLKDLDLDQIECTNVDLLIGTDNFDLLEPMKKRKGRKGDPYAVLTPVGWTIFGARGKRGDKRKQVDSAQTYLEEDIVEEEICCTASVAPLCFQRYAELEPTGLGVIKAMSEGEVLDTDAGSCHDLAELEELDVDAGRAEHGPDREFMVMDADVKFWEPALSTQPNSDMIGGRDALEEPHSITDMLEPLKPQKPHLTIEPPLPPDMTGDYALPQLFSDVITETDVECIYNTEEWKEQERPCVSPPNETIAEEVVTRLFEFFKTEEVPPCPRYSEEEQYVLDLWDRTWRLVEGHIELPIPFREEPPCFPDNYRMAVAALLALGRRLKQNPKELAQYKFAMDKAVEHGFSELVTAETVVNLKYVWYLLHHGVDHPRKPDVTRVVKNGSGKYLGVCLNEMTFQGPDLMNDLIKVMLGFRLYQIGVTGDVDGMFDQVLVPEHQRDCQRYLWFEDGNPDGIILVYRMRTHSFGTNWAPAAANYALQKTIDITPVSDSEKVNQSVANDFYVDDWLDSEETDQAASEMVAGVRKTVAKGGFNIGKFTSNSRKVLSRIELDRRAKEIVGIDLFRDKLPVGFSLGSGWDQESDKLVYRLKDEPKPLTRRGTTSFVASLFDPMGLIAPAVLPGKLLLRESCKAGEKWDTPLPEPLEEQWEKWIENMADLNEFKVDRWIGCRSGCNNELHIFGDACEVSYGAARFICVRDVDDEYVESALLMAKSKLAPKHVITVPRMELCAAVLAVKLGRYLQAVLRVTITAVYYWSDSAIILKLMLGDPSAYKPFFGNRISYLQERTEAGQWGHVPTNANPADLVSRGVPVKTLIDNEFWIHGPEFLRSRRDEWPSLEGDIPVGTVTNEMRKNREIFSTSVSVLQRRAEIVPELKSSEPDFLEIYATSAWAGTTDEPEASLLSVSVSRGADLGCIIEYSTTIETGYAAGLNTSDARGCIEEERGVCEETANEPLYSGVSGDDAAQVSASVAINRKSSTACKSGGSMKKFLGLRSSLTLSVKMVAWLRRFVHYITTGMLVKGPLEVAELERAELSLVKANQLQYLTAEEKNTPGCKKLFPIVGDDGCIRVGGRLRNSSLSESSKHQYIVPAESPLARQIIEDAHSRVGHAAVDWTIAEIRKKYWILGGRLPIAMFVRLCIRCRKFSGKPVQQLMADLPKERVDFNTPAFWNTGVDLFGPFHVVVKRSTEKRHGALFTCLTTRAIHLEVVLDLSASSFLNALARFIARRGKPRRIRSDNGTNFVCSRKIIGPERPGVSNEVVQRKLAEVGIDWSLNTPGGSHQGGAWERMIRTVRKLLTHTLDDVKLTHEVLETSFCAVEQIVNDRPLTRVSEDPGSLVTLTPSMLLNLRPGGKLVDRDFTSDRLRRDWRQAQSIADDFWTHWVARYLPELQKRAKWEVVKENVKVGELILMVNEACARGDWPLGVMLKVHP